MEVCDSPAVQDSAGHSSGWCERCWLSMVAASEAPFWGTASVVGEATPSMVGSERWAGEYEAHFARCSAVDSSNETIDAEWKAYSYTDGKVCWEARRFLLVFADRPQKKFEIQKILDRARLYVSALLESWGTSFDAEVFPSFKAASCQGGGALVNPKALAITHITP